MIRLFQVTILLLSVSQLTAQTVQREVICVNGNYTENGGLKVSQTIGEPIAETFNGPDITTLIVQGFEQQFGSLLTVGLEIFEYEISVYPNPTLDFVYLDFPKEIPENLSLQIYGVDGKFYGEQELFQNTKVDLKKLAASSYFLSIVNKNDKQLLKSNPIQKTK